jgi:hypothetical protein
MIKFRHVLLEHVVMSPSRIARLVSHFTQENFVDFCKNAVVTEQDVVKEMVVFKFLVKRVDLVRIRRED